MCILFIRLYFQYHITPGDRLPASGGSERTPGSAASVCSQHLLRCIWRPEQFPMEQKYVEKRWWTQGCFTKTCWIETTGPEEVTLGALLKTYSSDLPGFGVGRAILMHTHTHGHTVCFLLKICKKRCRRERTRWTLLATSIGRMSLRLVENRSCINK